MEDDIRREAAWIMASQPPLTHTPSCKGESDERTEWWMALARHLDVSRCSTSPTAMGRRPLLFLWQARRVAPQRWGKTGGERPAARRLMKLDREESAELARSGEGHPTASCRWLGRRPDGP